MPPAKETFQKGLSLPFAGGRLVAAPYQFVTTGEESLRVVSANSLAGVRIKLQGLRLNDRGENHPFAYDHIPNSDRTIVTTDHPIGIGGLLHLTAFVSGASPLVGQTFVIVQVIRGAGAAAIVLGTLLQGYVTSTQGLGWPGSPIQSSIEGGGYIRQVTGTMPAAGANISETVPAGCRWELQVLNVLLTTSAAAGNRTPFLFIDTPANVIAVSGQSGFVPASSTYYVQFATNEQCQALTAGGVLEAPIPSPFALTAGQRFRTVTVNLAAGDQYVAPYYVVREWLEVP